MMVGEGDGESGITKTLGVVDASKGVGSHILETMAKKDGKGHRDRRQQHRH